VEQAKRYLSTFSADSLSLSESNDTELIDYQRIVPSNADRREIEFLNSLTLREFPENIRLVCEYFRRVNLITIHADLDLQNITNETEFLAASWITYKTGEAMYRNPQLLDKKTKEFLFNEIQRIIIYLKLINSEFEKTTATSSKSITMMNNFMLQTCHSAILLNPQMNKVD